MTGPPTVQVLLDDGTGTYPIDVSSRVHLPSGVSVSSYGRTDEFSQAQAAQLQLTLDNSDGALSVGSGFESLGFDVGGFGGAIGLTAGQGIRYRLTKGATSKDRFTGNVLGGLLDWPGGQGGLSEIAVTAMDPLADLGILTLRSMLEEDILADAPGALWTLGEAGGTTTAGDTSGNQAPVMAVRGRGAAPTFGVTGPSVDGWTMVKFADGKHLEAAVVPTSSYTIAALMTHDATTPFGLVLGTTRYYLELVTGLGQVQLMHAGATPLGSGNRTTDTVIATSALPVTDGQPHVVGFSVQAGAGATLLVDGAATFVADASASDDSSVIWVGGYEDSNLADDGYDGTLAMVGYFSSALGAVRTAEYLAASTDGLVETTAARFARLAAYAGLASTTTTGMSGQTMGAQPISGQSALEALEAVAAAEGGLVYANGSGTLVLQGRGYRAGKTVADVTLSEDEIAPDTSVALDNQQQVKQVTVSRPGGAEQLVGSGVPSIDLELIVDNDDDALRSAQWIVAKHTNPGPRIGSGLFDLMTSASAEQLLARDLGDRFAFTGLPSQMWEGAGDVVADGWTETVTDQIWTLEPNLLPWSLFTALVLDDPVYGALDAFPLMN